MIIRYKQIILQMVPVLLHMMQYLMTFETNQFIVVEIEKRLCRKCADP